MHIPMLNCWRRKKCDRLHSALKKKQFLEKGKSLYRRSQNLQVQWDLNTDFSDCQPGCYNHTAILPSVFHNFIQKFIKAKLFYIEMSRIRLTLNPHHSITHVKYFSQNKVHIQILSYWLRKKRVHLIAAETKKRIFGDYICLRKLNF